VQLLLLCLATTHAHPYNSIHHFHMSHNPFLVGGEACLHLSTVPRFVATVFRQMGKNDFCCAPNCSNRRNRQRNIQFYRIPKDKAVRRKWLQRIRRKGFEPTESTRLCSQHFLGGKRSMDPANASYLPSLFDHSHAKSVKTRITQTSCNAGSQVDDVPKVKRKSSRARVSQLNALQSA